MFLDNYGFPDIALANDILVHMDDLGESRDDLEKSWWKWSHHNPFDAKVSGALLELYRNRLAKINKKNSAAAYQRLERKIKLLQKRAARYKVSTFSQSHQPK
jgi:hypothetical protein